MGKQCREAINKANRILGMIKRNFTDRSVYINSLVQKSSQTKLIKDEEHLLYNDRLEHLVRADVSSQEGSGVI